MEDSRIVDLYWQRDEAAIAETEKKYGKYCLSVARRILDDRQDAEECVNDTYLGAWNAMPPHRPAVLSTFLGKITRRLSLKKRRFRTADKRGGGVVAESLDELEDCIPSGERIDEALEGKELEDAVNAFLGTSAVVLRAVRLRLLDENGAEFR